MPIDVPIEGVPFTVALIQGNIQYDWEWRTTHTDEIYRVYEKLSRDASRKSAPHHLSLIIWPEYALPIDLNGRPDLLASIRQLSRETNASILLGTLHWKEGSIKGWRKENNIALLVSPNGSLAEYTSTTPIPFQPWTIPGEKNGLLSVGNTEVGVSLCYEETQRDLHRVYAKEGSSFIISLANNLMFTPSRLGLRFTSKFSRVNAAENRQFVLRATNTGITQIVNPYGKVVASLPPNKERAIMYTLRI